MEKIHIGTVLKPQGIAGQIKISDYTDGPSALKNLTQVFIGEEEFKVLVMTLSAGMFSLKDAGKIPIPLVSC